MITINEAYEKYKDKISKRTLYRWVQNGYIKGTTKSQLVFIDEDVLKKKIELNSGHNGTL